MSQVARGDLVETKLLTYAELAEALGITAASAKRLAIRRGWAKTPGNDGKARVAVPVERLELGRVTSDDTSDVTEANTSDVPGDEGTAAATVAAILNQHIERLGSELELVRVKLEAAERERDMERARAAQVEVLNAILDAERNRSSELRQERDKWEQLATAPKGLLAWLRR
jgi:hypothetical protein